MESWDSSDQFAAGLESACYCLRCEGFDPPRLPSVALTHEHLTRHHGIGAPLEGQDWVFGQLDEALRARGQLTLDSVVLARFRDQLTALSGVDDLLRMAKPAG